METASHSRLDDWLRFFSSFHFLSRILCVIHRQRMARAIVEYLFFLSLYIHIFAAINFVACCWIPVKGEVKLFLFNLLFFHFLFSFSFSISVSVFLSLFFLHLARRMANVSFSQSISMVRRFFFFFAICVSLANSESGYALEWGYDILNIQR